MNDPLFENSALSAGTKRSVWMLLQLVAQAQDAFREEPDYDDEMDKWSKKIDQILSDIHLFPLPEDVKTFALSYESGDEQSVEQVIVDKDNGWLR